MKLMIERKYLNNKWELIKLLFGKSNGIVLNIGNITFDENDSLIIHSHKNIESSIAVKVMEDGSLKVALSPPSTQHNFITKGIDTIFIDSVLKATLAPIFIETKKLKRK
jgi:hypothetical protein